MLRILAIVALAAAASVAVAPAAAPAATPAAAPPVAPAAPPQQVALRFQWPDAVTLHVERTFEKTESRPEGARPPIVFATRYTWRGASSGSGYRIAFSDFEVVRQDPRPKSRDAMVQIEYLSRELEPLLPTLVIGSGAQPTNLEGLADMQKRVAAEFGKIPGLAEDASAKRSAEVLAADVTISQRVLEDWNRMVQVWHGATVPVGEPKESTTDIEIPGGATIQNRLSYTLERRLPCGEGDTAESCVRLVVRQTPQSADTRALANAILGFDFVTALRAPTTATVTITNTYTTDTHPGTLLPVRYVKEKAWSITWTDGRGDPQQAARTDRWTYTFKQVEEANALPLPPPPPPGG